MTSSGPTAPAKAMPGFAPGKRVWFKETWDGALLAKKYGDHLVIVREHLDGYIDVMTTDREARIPKQHLRLTPPPGLSAPKKKAPAKPKVRKEAIDPAKGTELTIFDALEG